LTDSHPALSPQNVYDYLANVFYARRSKINPLWNSILVGGWDHNKSEPFLGYVDLLGTTYSSPTLATGFGAHIAQPLLREAFEAKAGEDGTGEKLTAEEAEALIDECMKVLFYRDARSINKVSRPVKKSLWTLMSSTKSLPLPTKEFTSRTPRHQRQNGALPRV
jgi:20S proteasome subunit beta 7